MEKARKKYRYIFQDMSIRKKIFFGYLAIIGIVNAAKGTFTKLPILGQIDFISKHFEK